MEIEAARAAPSARTRTLARPGWLTDAIVMDAAFLAAITVLALVVRLWDLGNYPYGLHGDEAWTGIDARRIMDGVDLWPYTDSALGQPAGPMYWAVMWEKMFGPTVFAARLPMALFGAGTVVFGFLALRELFGRPAAYCGAVLLAFSSWLIFYNRTGYSVSAMPFTEVASLYFVALALNRRWWAWYVLAGAVVGLGIYGYYSYPLFAAGLGLFVLAHAVIERPQPLIVHARNVLVMGLAALLLIQPMWPYLTRDTAPGYRKDREVFALSTKDYYKEEDFSGKVDIYWENFEKIAQSLLREGIPEASDGSGSEAAFDSLTVVVAGAGLAFCVVLAFRRRRVAYLLPFFIIPFVLAGAVWSENSSHRRALGILPFVLMPAAVLLGYVWTSLWEHRRESRVLVAALFVAVLAGYAWINLDKYFDDVNDSVLMRHTFGTELLLASRLMADEPDGTHIYFASERWGAGYETVRYLVDGHSLAKGNIEDRSRAFRPSQPGFDEIDRSRPSLIVMMDAYLRDADAVAARYPDGERLTGESVAGAPAYVAFRVPAADVR